jgi:hypothetical protein
MTGKCNEYSPLRTADRAGRFGRRTTVGLMLPVQSSNLQVISAAMRKPSIFVSATCYDLKQLRADLYSYAEHAGLEPVLSEYPSFPVDSDQTTVENCRKAVETRADVFVLVIGARYGSVVEHGKSVTNLEYLTAKAKGIPVYVFVMQSILDILPVWKANATGHFDTVADSPKPFQFVSEIRDAGDNWVFPFNTAQDIIGVLRTLPSNASSLIGTSCMNHRWAAGSASLTRMSQSPL